MSCLANPSAALAAGSVRREPLSDDRLASHKFVHSARTYQPAWRWPRALATFREVLPARELYALGRLRKNLTEVLSRHLQELRLQPTSPRMRHGALMLDPKTQNYRATGRRIDVDLWPLLGSQWSNRGVPASPILGRAVTIFPPPPPPQAHGRRHLQHQLAVFEEIAPALAKAQRRGLHLFRWQSDTSPLQVRSQEERHWRTRSPTARSGCNARSAAPTRVLGLLDLVLFFVVRGLHPQRRSVQSPPWCVTGWLWISSLVAVFVLAAGHRVIELAHRFPGGRRLVLWTNESRRLFTVFSLPFGATDEQHDLRCPRSCVIFVACSCLFRAGHESLADHKSFTLTASLVLLFCWWCCNVLGPPASGSGLTISARKKSETFVAAGSFIVFGNCNLAPAPRFVPTVRRVFPDSANPRFVSECSRCDCFVRPRRAGARIGHGGESANPQKTLPVPSLGAASYPSGLRYIGATRPLLIAVAKPQSRASRHRACPWAKHAPRLGLAGSFAPFAFPAVSYHRLPELLRVARGLARLPFVAASISICLLAWAKIHPKYATP